MKTSVRKTVQQEIITSLQNPKIKEVKKLRDSRVRRSLKLFLCEGAREIQKAFEASFQLEKLLYCEELLNSNSRVLIQKYEVKSALSISRNCFESLTVRDNRDGLLAVFKERQPYKLENLQLSKVPSVLILSGVEKPGNIGAMVRCADGAGVEALLITGDYKNNEYDLYNPNLIRASLGCVFSLPIIVCSEATAYQFCQQTALNIWAAHQSEKSKLYWDVSFKEGFGLVVGSEAKGVSPFWQQKSKSFIHLPMKGVADSLNVSGACAALLYESRRQRDSLP